MFNERKTETIFRSRLQDAGNYHSADVRVEEQKSDFPRIHKLLRSASKKGDGAGYPDFIVSSEKRSDFLVIIECKADETKHVSEEGNRYAHYAVDGVLLYADFLSKEFDVLAIAVSGQTESSLRISHYLQLRGSSKAIEFPLTEILHFDEYYEQVAHSEIKTQQDFGSLLAYSRELNEELREAKIKEAHRGLLICGILVALGNEAFRKSFAAQNTARHLADSLVNAILNEFRSADLPENRVSNLRGAFSFIRQNTTLTSDKNFFIGLVEEIDAKVNTFIRTYKYHDALGQFYVQFLRYANNDKGLGIVLTPPHVADLFADLADVNTHSVVYDNCCGTAGLLIAAMKRMLSGNTLSNETKGKIKTDQLIGIEFQDDIYALAVSNMVIHGDGKTNILLGDCFEKAKWIKKHYKPNVGLLNPPYKTKMMEFEFVLNNLEVLEVGGTCVAIIPLSCVIGYTSKLVDLKRRILEHHTLEAVMSMPAGIFDDSKVGVVTCIVVITAHKPHPPGRKTWFGYWRDDGYVKTKHMGRIDMKGQWPEIKERWLDAFRNREVVDRQSVTVEVGPRDEWCAEAYFETDYSTLTESDFEDAIKKYVAYRILNDR